MLSSYLVVISSASFWHVTTTAKLIQINNCTLMNIYIYELQEFERRGKRKMRGKNLYFQLSKPTADSSPIL